MAWWEPFVPGYGVASAGKKYFFDDPAQQQKDALDKAMGMSQENSKQLQQFYAQQKQAALANFAPLQHMFNQSYGTGGIQPPRLPRGGGGGA